MGDRSPLERAVAHARGSTLGRARLDSARPGCGDKVPLLSVLGDAECLRPAATLRIPIYVLRPVALIVPHSRIDDRR